MHRMGGRDDAWPQTLQLPEAPMAMRSQLVCLSGSSTAQQVVALQTVVLML